MGIGPVNKPLDSRSFHISVSYVLLRRRSNEAAIQANRKLGQVEAPVYASNHFEIFHPWEQSRLLQQAVRLAQPGSIVLDVGMGTGNVLGKFPSTTVRVGIDLSEEMLRVARKSSEGMHLVQAEAGALPFSNGVFHVVYTYSTLHHVGDGPAAVLEMARVVRPGGILVLDHEWAFQEDGWRAPVYRALRASLRAAAAAWYWRRPSARAYLSYRRVHWPYSATFRDVDLELAEGGELLPALAEAILTRAGLQSRRWHYLLEPLPMMSVWQAAADQICRTFRLGHFFIQAYRPRCPPSPPGRTHTAGRAKSRISVR